MFDNNLHRGLPLPGLGSASVFDRHLHIDSHNNSILVLDADIGVAEQ